MNTADRQRDRLRRTIEWARKIEDRLGDVRERHLGQVHFRPSSTGISMIGLRPDRPQRGKSAITNLTRLAAEFEREYAEHCVTCDHRRETPEKRVQSYLLARAYRDRRALRDLQRNETDLPLEFVTDELSLPLDDGEIVCDLLALHGDRLAAIELQPARQLKRLVQQVTDYATMVDKHADLFGGLCSVILARPVELRAPCERWIVWPHPVGYDGDPRENQLAALGVRVVGYIEIDGAFEFKVGRRLDDSISANT